MNADIKKPDGRNNLEDKEKFNDMRLDKNGEKTTLKTEIARKVTSFQKGGNINFLQHDIMVIACADKGDTKPYMAENALSNTGVNWNILSIRGKQFLDDKPEILRFLKPLNIVAAAKKAGVINKNYGQNTVGLILIILLCTVICGMVFIFSDGNSGRNFSLVQLSGTLQSRGFIISCGIGSMAGLLIQRVLSKRHLINDANLMKKIISYADQIDSNAEISSVFLENVKEEILNLQMPLAIVVRDHEFLDVFTKRLLADILTVEKEQNIGLILWILMDYEKSGVENELVSLISKKGKTTSFSYQNYRFESYV
ncbi:MAG TPA: hypothetical protein VHP36_10580 [Chitinispirillaceae bacterium]|nr:hypothetical protein [Chitinispirillaceae bacterium]